MDHFPSWFFGLLVVVELMVEFLDSYVVLQMPREHRVLHSEPLFQSRWLLKVLLDLLEVLMLVLNL